MTPGPLTPRLLTPRLGRAYRATRYAVDDIPVRIGRRSPRLDPPGSDGAGFDRRGPIVLLTAWNPRSRRMPQGWNHRMQDRLRAHLRRRTVRDADGRLRRWREAHVAVQADPRWCLVLARRFRQHAIVVILRHQPVRLVMLD